MELIAILYICAAFVALAAGIPQIVQLLRIRCSEEFQLSTWVTWLVTQTVTLTYVISIGNHLMTIANAAWVTFYLIMVILIIRFRQRTLFRFKVAQTTTAVTVDRSA